MIVLQRLKGVSEFKKISREDYEAWRRMEILLNLCVKYKLLSPDEAQFARDNNGELPNDILIRLYKKSISQN